ncbi:Primosome PriB/single-strand DNA-binding [Heracleum sosnowskyi]|uniref:Primosome PriB/single-strand DNA-binding n=1 Tax=Heracleum sosnowskyi TaxID=360622 RepID=A0AAD8IRZ9_9APIA|nr:Primosome PriB/single-strand DNA-binding [Heracleum sosnowskyi]
MAAVWRSIHRGSSLLLHSSLVVERSFTSSLSYNSTHLKNHNNDDESELSAYERALKYKRPPTIKHYHRDTELNNSVSLIGVVTRPVCPINKKTQGNAGAYTVLKVNNTSSSSQSTHRPVWILLNMWGKMAEICTTYIKPDDLVYVSGYLGSYSKVDKNGVPSANYKVNVMNINYVQSHSQAPTCERAKQSRVEDSAESSLDRYNNRLHLWQVFFTNPLEWYDNRKSKKSPNHPDFRHKDTGEVLWLKHSDPPWIQKQLELQDSRLAGRQIGISSDLTPLVYDDFS